MLFAVLNPKGITTSGLASSHFARRYFGNLFWFLFLRLLRCFSSAGLPTYDYFIHHRLIEYCSTGFPHSEIHGSMDICSSPWLIAACHVLLRLLMPRHSSYALLCLTSPALAPLSPDSLAANHSSAPLCLLFHKNSVFMNFQLGFASLSLLPFSVWTISRSPSLIMWVSFVSSLDTLRLFTLSVTLFLFEKTFSFSYSFFFIQFSNISSNIFYDAWKVYSEKRLL